MALGRRFGGRGGGAGGGGGGGGGGLQALRNAMDRLVRDGVLNSDQVERIRQAVKEERQKLRGGRGGRADGGDGGDGGGGKEDW